MRLALPVFDKLEFPENRQEAVRVAADRALCELLYALVENLKPLVTLEIGLAYGASAAHIIAASEGHHTIIEAFPKSTQYYGEKNLEKLELSRFCEVIYARSDITLAKLAADKFRPEFVFIDGGHKFDDIFVDFHFVSQMVTQGGMIVFDDLWMRSTKAVASWISRNRTDFRPVEFPSSFSTRVCAFERVGHDTRRWDHYEPFET
jgi:predicted O-methyltransferase YrrM